MRPRARDDRGRLRRWLVPVREVGSCCYSGGAQRLRGSGVCGVSLRSWLWAEALRLGRSRDLVGLGADVVLSPGLGFASVGTLTVV